MVSVSAVGGSVSIGRTFTRIRSLVFWSFARSTASSFDTAKSGDGGGGHEFVDSYHTHSYHSASVLRLIRLCVFGHYYSI